MWGTTFFNAGLQLFGDNILAPRTSFLPKRFVPGTFRRCNISTPKNKNLPFLYETRAIFSHEIFGRKFCYRRLTCTKTPTHDVPASCIAPFAASHIGTTSRRGLNLLQWSLFVIRYKFPTHYPENLLRHAVSFSSNGNPFADPSLSFSQHFPDTLSINILGPVSDPIISLFFICTIVSSPLPALAPEMDSY